MLSISLKEAIKQVRAGKISAKEMCEKCYKRMAQIRDLNAFITETKSMEPEDRSLANSHLAGLPIAVKDNFCTKGIRTSCGSKMLDNFVPPYTATVVQKLINHGAVLAGKTNMDEFAMGCGSTDSFYGPVLNLWKIKFKHRRKEDEYKERNINSDNTHSETISHTKSRLSEGDVYIAGGSSGGSAVAVAAGTCFGALSSDTGGSTRNPASYCGVVGLKPTFGLLSRHGLIPLVNSLDVPGIMARTVEDVTIILNTIAGHDINDSTTVTEQFKPCDLDTDFSVEGLCVGIPKEYHAPGLSPEVLQAWSEAADMFENAGAKVVEVSLPHTQYSLVTYSVLCACEVASNMARYDGVEYGHRANNMRSTEDMYAQSRHEGFNDVVRGRIFAGNYFLLRENYEKHFLHALKLRRLISNDFKSVYKSGVDILLTPTTLSDAPAYKWFIEADNRTRTSVQDVFTQPVNMAGIPAVNVPFKLSTNSLPIGLQIIGQNFKDHQMLNVARWLETQANFPHLDLSHLDNL